MGLLNSGSKEKKESLEKGLEKSKKNFLDKLSKAIIGKSRIDEAVLDNLEEILINSDVGIETTLKIIDKIETRVAKDKYVSTSELKHIKDEIVCLL